MHSTDYFLNKREREQYLLVQAEQKFHSFHYVLSLMFIKINTHFYCAFRHEKKNFFGRFLFIHFRLLHLSSCVHSDFDKSNFVITEEILYIFPCFNCYVVYFGVPILPYSWAKNEDIMSKPCWTLVWLKL